MQDDSFEQIKLPEKPEEATGKDLDPLLAPPDKMSIVHLLKEKMDEFSKLVYNYQGSKKQLQQVMIALGLNPFTESSPEFGYPEQQKLYDLGVQILADKLLFLHIGIKEQEIAKNIRETTSPEATINNENKEVENGKEN